MKAYGKTAPKEFDDGSLIARARLGDPSAFSALYLRHASHIARVAYRLTGSDSVLEDIVQETFVDAFGSLDSVQDPDRFRTWLVTIAVRKSKRYFAGRYRRWALSREYGQQAKDVASETDPDFSEIYEALDRLPDNLRVPWLLHRVQEMTLPEVTEVTGRSLASVKRDIARATEKLRRYLDDA